MNSASSQTSESYVNSWKLGYDSLLEIDPSLAELLLKEKDYQERSMPLVAYASMAEPSVLAAGATELGNVTAEGYPGSRFHPGCQNLDKIEELAIVRAKRAFGADYVNVQPHSGSQANTAVLQSLLTPGDAIMGMDLDSGGHLTHGSKASNVGRAYDVRSYGLDANGYIDYDDVKRIADQHQPKVIFAGASAYSRQIDYHAFRAIADRVGAILIADISHISGLVAAEVIPSPIDIAHITTSSTYKQLGGPRGGLILTGANSENPAWTKLDLQKAIQRGVFPRTQGTLNPQSVASKARVFDLIATDWFREWMLRVKSTATGLASALAKRGFELQSGGTDTHMVLTDLRNTALSGLEFQNGLEEVGILANKNRVPGDQRPPHICSGVRFGTNVVAQRGWTTDDMDSCAGFVADVRDVLEAGSNVPRGLGEIATRVSAFVDRRR